MYRTGVRPRAVVEKAKKRPGRALSPVPVSIFLWVVFGKMLQFPRVSGKITAETQTAAGRRVFAPPHGPMRVKVPLNTTDESLHRRLIIPVGRFFFKGELAGKWDLCATLF